MADGDIIKFTSPVPNNPDFDPVDLEPLETGGESGWFETKTTFSVTNTVTGEGMEAIGWLIAQGWILDHTTTSGDFKTYYFNKQVLKASVALDALIAQTTAAYNTGRKVNDDRYDELVALYKAYLGNSEDSLKLINDDDEIFAGLVDTLNTALETAYTTHETAVLGVLDEDESYGEARAAEIEAKFDEARSQATARYANLGLSATTISEPLIALYNNQESQAVSDLNDRVNDRNLNKLNIRNNLFQQKLEVKNRVLAARERAQNVKDTGWLNRLDVQAKLVMAMLGFMERREDGYPTIDSINQVAAQFGSAYNTEVAP